MFPWDPSEAEAADVEGELPEYNLELHFTETMADAKIAVRICKKKQKNHPKTWLLVFSSILSVPPTDET